MKLTPLDRAWAAGVKEREEWVCQRCHGAYVAGSRGLNAHHIFTRSRKSTRHLLVNGVALCVGCHRWAHANPLEFHELAQQWLGADEYDELQALSRTLKRR